MTTTSMNHAAHVIKKRIPVERICEMLKLMFGMESGILPSPSKFRIKTGECKASIHDTKTIHWKKYEISKLSRAVHRYLNIKDIYMYSFHK